jgi:beta-galactosidase
MVAKQLFNDKWVFLKTELNVEFHDMKEYYSQFKPIDIPHDWLIYDAKNLYENSCGWYRKTFCVVDSETYEQDILPNTNAEKVCADLNSSERIQIRFDGIYMDCSVYLNDIWIGDWKYGYSAFDFDLTEYVKQGENEILVQVRHQSPNSRWYSGAGIYRNVWIRVCKEVYLPWDGTYVVSKPCKEGYVMEVKTEIAGMISESTKCRYSLYYKDNCILDLGWQQRTQTTIIQNSIDNSEIQSGIISELTAIVENPKIWDIDSPECYNLRVELYHNNSNQPVDVQIITIGFRHMELDPNKGFILNGRNVKVHGVCEHHDFGCLGAAFNKEAMRRKFHLLRKMGVNSIRTSHNMPAYELMELANEMGFLIVSESFDMWERKKTEYDYSRFFKEWAQKDVASWVRRDRNHPSLMLWCIGNEIYDTHADEYGQEITKRLIRYVREHDPKENALITIGSNFMPWENARKCADIVKIAGYNYGEKYYEEHHKCYPNWVIYGSETGSIVQSRGVYHFPMSQSVLADEDEQCSALGNSTTSWGAKSVEKCITDDRDAEFNFGQFLWTGFDYIGEPTPYHTKNSYFGQIDTAGFPKDSYYVFQAEWTDVKKNPMVHLFPYWDFNEGQLIDVRACTNGASVELFVNGVSKGKQGIDHLHGKKLLGEWQVPYTPGEIQAVAYDTHGNVIAKESKYSFTEGVKLSLQANKTELVADGWDLCFLTIEVEDENDHIVENAMNYVQVTVSGEGRLLGLDNGDSTDYDPYKTNRRKLFNGKLLAVIGTTKEAGEIVIKVQGTGLKSAEVKLFSKEIYVPKGISAIENIYTARNICVTKHLDTNKNKDMNVDETQSHSNTDIEFVDTDIEFVDTEIIPVRKVELIANKGQIISPDKKELLIQALIFPDNASDHQLIWKVVNDSGIDIEFADVEEICVEGNLHMAKIMAFGDGDFRIRCMSKSSTEKVKIISQLEIRAQGLGQAFLNPYGYISGGLFTDSIGEIGNGNEKGIATARDGISGVVYSSVDFGDYGSDEITIDVFALSSDKYPIEMWIGKPGEEGSYLLKELIYQKPSKWNVYQEETWKLPKRIRGISTIAFMLKSKVHVKGFHFKQFNKAISRLMSTECNRIYGDNFVIGEDEITDIGNNVTLEYENMDFGTKGVSSILICGKTKNEVNTIHIHFTDKNGETVNRIVEFKKTLVYKEQEYSIKPFYGKGKVEFIFLPGSSFDLKSFQFSQCCAKKI